PEIQFQSATYEVREGEPVAVLKVQRNGDLTHSAQVDFETINGTAGQRPILAGKDLVEDFTSTSGTLVFRPRANLATIQVPIRDDAIIESDETFTVKLTNPSAGSVLGAIPLAQVVIHDNDPSISFVKSSSSVTESGTGRGSGIEVRLDPASTQKVTVAYNAVSGTATAGQDYRPAG